MAVIIHQYLQQIILVNASTIGIVLQFRVARAGRFDTKLITVVVDFAEMKGGHSRGACASAAGLRQPGPALPCVQLDNNVARAGGKINIRAFRQQAVFFKLETILGGKTCRAAINENHRMRVAHIDHKGRWQIGMQRDLRRVRHLFCQRNVFPAPSRRRHDDAGEIDIIYGHLICRHLGLQCATQRFNDRLRGALPCKIGRHGARAIAASLNLAAIGVENLHEHIAFAEAGIAVRVQNQKLVASFCCRVVARGQRAHVFGRQRQSFAAGVDHHKIIAEAVHFGESDGACPAHGSLYNPSRARTPAPAMCRFRPT